jgi:DNA-binding beta-propeller fold protein YncE
MSDDLDRLLKSSLSSVGDEYETGHQQRRPEARAEFIRRYNKRRWIFPTFTALGATAVIAALVIVGASVLGGSDSPADLRPDDAQPIQPGGRPGFELTVPLGGAPTDVAALGGGIWIANPGEGNVTRLDPLTAEVIATVDIGGTPSVISVGPNYVWVGDRATGTLRAIDPANNEFVRGPFEIGDPDDAMVISVGTDHVWVVLNDQLFMVDDQSGEATMIDGITQAIDVAAVSGPVWVLDGELGLVRIDGETGARIGEPVKDVDVQDGDVFAASELVWLADRSDESIVTVDPETGEFRGTLSVTGAYIDAAFGPNAVWILSQVADATHVTAYDPGTRQQLAPPHVLAGPATELATAQGGVWATLAENGQVVRIDTKGFLDR